MTFRECMQVRHADRMRTSEAWQHTAWLLSVHAKDAKPWDLFPSAFPASVLGGGDSGIGMDEQEAALAMIERRRKKEAKRKQKT